MVYGFTLHLFILLWHPSTEQSSRNMQMFECYRASCLVCAAVKLQSVVWNYQDFKGQSSSFVTVTAENSYLVEKTKRQNQINNLPNLLKLSLTKKKTTMDLQGWLKMFWKSGKTCSTLKFKVQWILFLHSLLHISQ